MIERRELDLVNDDEVVAADLLDRTADGVVSDSAVEVLDEIDGGEVADFVPGVDSDSAEAGTGFAARALTTVDVRSQPTLTTDRMDLKSL